MCVSTDTQEGTRSKFAHIPLLSPLPFPLPLLPFVLRACACRSSFVHICLLRCRCSSVLHASSLVSVSCFVLRVVLVPFSSSFTPVRVPFPFPYPFPVIVRAFLDVTSPHFTVCDPTPSVDALVRRRAYVLYCCIALRCAALSRPIRFCVRFVSVSVFISVRRFFRCALAIALVRVARFASRSSLGDLTSTILPSHCISLVPSFVCLSSRFHFRTRSSRLPVHGRRRARDVVRRV